jgi:L-threonylcarbamoyladenylate synthase
MWYHPVMKNLSLREIVSALKPGVVGVIPSDTVYGLVARAGDRQAVERLYALKSREHKPGTVIAASVVQLIELGLPEQQLRRVEHLWPNPLSVILPARPELAYIHQDLDSFPVRIPKDKELRAVLELTVPLATSSANLPGEPPAVSVAEAREYFGDQVDFYVDGGELANRAPSTIIRIVGDEIEVIRQGAVEIDKAGIHITEARRKGCPFCRSNGALKGQVLFSSEGAYLIESLSNSGRYLIIPEPHVESLADLPDTWWRDLKVMLARVPGLTRDFNVSINAGRNAGQTVKHLHFWVIPRAGGQSASGKGLARLIDEANEA